MILGQDFHDRNERLCEIYRVVEPAWEANLKRYKGKPIKYLLIAEAAPWSESGTPKYFYKALEGGWVGRILRTFFGKKRLGTDEEVWTLLADKGFLLIDTLPFALPYTTRCRKSDKYLELLNLSKEHFYTKLRKPELIFDNQMKVALAFLWNGRGVIKAYGGRIKLPNGRNVLLNEDLIAVDKSNYTNSNLLCEIWGLPEVERN